MKDVLSNETIGVLEKSRKKYASQNLIEGARKDHPSAIEFALENGADFFSTKSYKHKRDAVSVAAREGSWSAVRFLVIEKEFPVDGKDSFGNTALHLTGYCEDHGKALLTAGVLVSVSINLHEKNNSGKTALDIAKENGNSKLVKFLKHTEKMS